MTPHTSSKSRIYGGILSTRRLSFFASRILLIKTSPGQADGSPMACANARSAIQERNRKSILTRTVEGKDDSDNAHKTKPLYSNRQRGKNSGQGVAALG